MLYLIHCRHQTNQFTGDVAGRSAVCTDTPRLYLTKAGESLYQDAKYIIHYCNDAVARAQNAMQETGQLIRIGTSPMTPAQLLMPLWTKVRKLCPDLKFQVIPYENTSENAREILARLGETIDVVGGIFDETMLALRQCSGLELCRESFCIAVSLSHPLASRDKLAIEEIYDWDLLLMKRGWSCCVDALRDDLTANHPKIRIKDFFLYSTDIFNHCENSMDLLLAIPGWASVHPFLKLIPVDWNHTIPFGLLHSPHPSERVARFLAAAKETIQS